MLHSTKARRGAAAALVGLLALGSWGWWTVASASAVDDVEIRWSLDCAEGTEVDAAAERPTVHSRPGWRCDVRVVVDNRSGTEVRLRQVQAGRLGSLGGSEVRGFDTDDADLVNGSDTAEATGWRIGEVVPAGETHTVTIALGWRESGCSRAGWIELDRWPKVTLEALGRTHRRAADQGLRIRTFDDAHDERTCSGPDGSKARDR